jgi:inhibitor of cysteine peptidase
LSERESARREAVPAVRLTREDAGGRRRVRVGEPIQVSLPEAPTTGYRWQADVDPGALRQVEDRFDPPGEARGGTGERAATFEAVRPGPARLRLVLRRSWEQEPAEEFAVDLDVQS